MPEPRFRSEPCPLDPNRLDPAGQRAVAALYWLPSGWYSRPDLADVLADKFGLTLKWTTNLLAWASRSGALPRFYDRDKVRRRRVAVILVERVQLERTWPDFDWRSFKHVRLWGVEPLWVYESAR